MAETRVIPERLSDFAPEDGGGLDLTVKAGRVRANNVLTDKSDQTVALTDDTTNFVEIDTDGVATDNTTGFTVGSIPIATVVTASGDITTITDKRTWVVRTENPDISARVFKSGAQSIIHNTVTELSYDTERWDTDTLHAPSGSRFTAVRKGKYLVSSSVTFASNTTGSRAALFRFNGAQVIARQDMAATASTTSITISMTTVYELDIGDQFHVEAFQTSGAALNVSLAEMTIQLMAETV